MTSKAFVLLFGVDTLIVNFKVPWSKREKTNEDQDIEMIPGMTLEINEMLSSWLERAKEDEEPYLTTWTHEGRRFHMYPKGTPTHRYLLKNGLIDLMIYPFLQNAGLARVRFSSEYLWKSGAEHALVSTHAFLWEMFQEHLNAQCSEIHICADVANFILPRNYEHVFVSRAATYRAIKAPMLDSPIYRYHELETLQFSGHGNPLSITMYDKPGEIQRKSQDKIWFHDLWKAEGWDEKAPIVRAECRIKREALHEMKLDDTYEVLGKIASLWTYCVGHPGQDDGWLRMVVVNNKDTNRRRWKTASSWEAVRKAFEKLHDERDIEEIQRKRVREVNLDRAEKAIAGYTTTYSAWLQDEITTEDDVSVVVQRLHDKMLDLWKKRGTDFHELRLKKQFDYHIS